MRGGGRRTAPMLERRAMPAAAAQAGERMALAAGGSVYPGYLGTCVPGLRRASSGVCLLVSVPGTGRLAKRGAARTGPAERGQRPKVQGQMWALWPPAARPGHGEDHLRPHSQKSQRRAPVLGVQRAVRHARLTASPALPGAEQCKGAGVQWGCPPAWEGSSSGGAGARFTFSLQSYWQE